jgi:hypothetical protein
LPRDEMRVKSFFVQKRDVLSKIQIILPNLCKNKNSR